MKSIIATIEGPHYACADGRVRLTAIVDDNEPNDTIHYAYQWYQNGNVISGAANSYYDFSAADLASDTTWFHVEVTKQYPTCITSRSAEFLFTRIQDAEIKLTASAGGCSTALLTAGFHSPTPGATPIEYSWIKDGAVVAYTTDPTYVTSSTGTYRVAATYQVGDVYCTDTSDVAGTAVTITGNSGSLMVDKSIVCEGASIRLTASSAGNTYTWYDGATRLDPTDSIITVSTLTEGNHYFRYVDNTGCTADTIVIAHSFSPQLRSESITSTCASGQTTGDVAFSIVLDSWALGGSFTYGWYKNSEDSAFTTMLRNFAS